MKGFTSQSWSTQVRKGEQLVSLMPATKKAFDLMGDDIVEISTETESSEKIGSYDENWLEESEARLLKQIDDEKRANLVMSRMEKQMKKQKSLSNIYLFTQPNDGIYILSQIIEKSNIQYCLCRKQSARNKIQQIKTQSERFI